MEKDYKVIVAHPYRQHSYQTAAAFQQNGTLVGYVTTIYNKPRSILSIVCKILPRGLANKLRKYHSSYIEDHNVITVCTFDAVIAQTLSHIPFAKQLSEIATSRMLKKFNKSLVRIVEDIKPNVLITYDTLSGDALQNLEDERIVKVVDMSAPYLTEMKKIYDLYLSHNKEGFKSLSNKFQSRTYIEKIDRATKELKYADYFLCASEFTKKTIVDNNINSKKVYICRYGKEFIGNEKKIISEYKNRRKLKGIYIGNVSYTKGVQYIIEALKMCEEYIEEFIFIGAIQDEIIIRESCNSKLKFTGYLAHNKVIELAIKSDFGVFPSLADGYGFAVMESLACGLPVICSENAGASDLICDGKNGFVVKAGDINQIYEKIKWFYENHDQLVQMKTSASESVKDLTMENYYLSLKEAIFDMVSRKSEDY